MIDMLGLGGHLLFLPYFISAASLSPGGSENAGIYMAINALAGVDEFGNVFKRRIEIVWTGAEVGLGWVTPVTRRIVVTCCRCWRGTEL